VVEEVADRAADSSAQDRDLEWDLLLTPRGVAGVAGVAAVGEGQRGAAATNPQNNKAVNTQTEAEAAAAAPPPPTPAAPGAAGTPQQTKKNQTHFLFVTYF
jgi:hypothetical protein